MSKTCFYVWGGEITGAVKGAWGGGASQQEGWLWYELAYLLFRGVKWLSYLLNVRAAASFAVAVAAAAAGCLARPGAATCLAPAGGAGTDAGVAADTVVSTLYTARHTLLGIVCGANQCLLSSPVHTSVFCAC